MMTDIEDEDDWATSDELADDDNDNNAVVAESALDRWDEIRTLAKLGE